MNRKEKGCPAFLIRVALLRRFTKPDSGFSWPIGRPCLSRICRDEVFTPAADQYLAWPVSSGGQGHPAHQSPYWWGSHEQLRQPQNTWYSQQLLAPTLTLGFKYFVWSKLSCHYRLFLMGQDTRLAGVALKRRPPRCKHRNWVRFVVFIYLGNSTGIFQGMSLKCVLRFVVKMFLHSPLRLGHWNRYSFSWSNLWKAGERKRLQRDGDH